jgi:hypothetical protein
VLRILPPVCRDCGKAAKEARLGPYLDFHLCAPCTARREREVMQVRRPASKPVPLEAKAKKPGAKKKRTRQRR